jgi:hypothetical protein
MMSAKGTPPFLSQSFRLREFLKRGVSRRDLTRYSSS